MTFKERYTPFPKENLLKIILPLTNLSGSKYKIVETIVNRQYGSAFDKWVESGALPIETKEDIDYLKFSSLPKIKQKIIYPNNNSLTLTVKLEPHEVRLIELKPLI